MGNTNNNTDNNNDSLEARWTRYDEAVEDRAMTEVTVESIGKIDTAVQGIRLDEFKARINPEAELVVDIPAEEVEAIDACDVAQRAVSDFVGGLAALDKWEFDAWALTKRAERRWDPTTRPVKFTGGGSDQELNGARPRPFNWRIAARMLQVKRLDAYKARLESAFRKVPYLEHTLPAGFLSA